MTRVVARRPTDARPTTDAKELRRFGLPWFRLLRRVTIRLKRNGVAAATVGVTILSLAAKSIAAAREVAVARRFGVGTDIDAFIFTFTIVSIAASVLGGAISTSLIPSLLEAKRSAGIQAVRQLAGRVLNLYVLSAAGLAVLLLALSPLISLTFSGDTASHGLVVHLTLLMVGPAMLAGGLSHYLSTLLNAERHFAAAALSPAAIPLTMLALLVAMPEWRDVRGLAVAAGGGFVLQSVALTVVSYRRRVLPTLAWRRRDPSAAGVMRQCLAAALSSLALTANPIVDMVFAARLGPGNVSVLGYGSRVVAVLLSVLGYAFATTSLPHLASLVSARDTQGLQKACRKMVGGSLLITVPITLLLVLASRPLVDAMYQGGAFTETDAAVVSHVQALYALHLPVFVIGLVFVRLINSLKRNGLLIAIAVPAVAANVLADLVLGNLLGVAGIALATSLVYSFTSVLAYLIASHLLRRQDWGDTTAVGGPLAGNCDPSDGVVSRSGRRAAKGSQPCLLGEVAWVGTLYSHGLRPRPWCAGPLPPNALFHHQ